MLLATLLAASASKNGLLITLIRGVGLMVGYLIAFFIIKYVVADSAVQAYPWFQFEFRLMYMYAIFLIIDRVKQFIPGTPETREKYNSLADGASSLLAAPILTFGFEGNLLVYLSGPLLLISIFIGMLFAERITSRFILAILSVSLWLETQLDEDTDAVALKDRVGARGHLSPGNFGSMLRILFHQFDRAFRHSRFEDMPFYERQIRTLGAIALKEESREATHHPEEVVPELTMGGMLAAFSWISALFLLLALPFVTIMHGTVITDGASIASAAPFASYGLVIAVLIIYAIYRAATPKRHASEGAAIKDMWEDMPRAGVASKD
jgi:hypothetical protein